MTQQRIAVSLLAIGLLFSFMNWICVISTWRTGRYSSTVPFFGAALLGAGALLLPHLRPYAWAVALLDIGTVLAVPHLPRLVREMWATSWFNLREKYVGRRGATTVHLRLFRRGIFTLWWEIKRPPGEYGLVGTGKEGTWEREADTLILRVGEDRAVFGPLGEGDSAGWILLVDFDDCARNSELSLTGIEFLKA
jgi:hypothetical protein